MQGGPERLWLTGAVCLLMMRQHLPSRDISIRPDEQRWAQNRWAPVIDAWFWEKQPWATESAHGTPWELYSTEFEYRALVLLCSVLGVQDKYICIHM